MKYGMKRISAINDRMLKIDGVQSYLYFTKLKHDRKECRWYDDNDDWHCLYTITQYSNNVWTFF